MFHYHKTDRTYKVVPTGQTKPLEDLKAPGWQLTWKSHREAVVKAMNALAADLKNALQPKTPEAKIAKSTTITENW
jgi:superoxide dismutase